MTLEACAVLALVTVLPQVYLKRLLWIFSKTQNSSASTGIHYAV